MFRHLRLLLALVCLAGLLPLVRPQIAPAAHAAVPAASGLIALPGSCGGGLPPGANVPACCMFGYVFIDGQAVEGAKVTITSIHGSVELWTATGPDSPQPYYRTSLSDPPLSAQAGDTLTIAARYSDHSHSISHTVLGGGQQVDVVLPSTQPDDYVFERQIWRQADVGKFNNLWGIAVDGSGTVYVADRDNERVQVFNSDGQFLRQWGTLGDQPGQFDDPFGIAVDLHGNVYVTDAGNARIQKFSSTGVWSASWGVRGNGSGQFQRPAGVTVDQSGNVYIVDSANHRVEKFRSDGAWLTGWGGMGNGNGQFQQPEGASVDAVGNVYVADWGNHRIQKFNASGGWLASWGSQGSGNGQFQRPQGVSADASGNVYVVDSGNHRIQKFSSAGVWLMSWGSMGTGNGQFQQPQGVSADTSGNVYVADWGNQRIQKFNASGGWLTSWGRQGSGDGQFVYSAGLAVDGNDVVYVTDRDNSRIHEFHANGDLLTTWGHPGSGNGQLAGPEGISVDGQGMVYVADRGNHRIQKFSNSGAWQETWGGPTIGSGNKQFNAPEGVSVHGTNVYVADTKNHRIQKFTSNGDWLLSWGSLGIGNGQFNEPAAVSVDPAGNVYVADRGNHRIQKFTANGVWVKTVGGPTSGTGSGQFYAPEGLQIDSSGNVYVADSGNHRIQKFNSAGVWLMSWGSQGSSVGQFDTPQGVGIDSSGNIYVVEYGHHRVQVFHPIAYTRPIATIVQASPRSVAKSQPVELHGRGGDSDTTSAIAAFEWTLDDSATPFASSPNTTLNTAALGLGAHTITLRVRDAQGEYSNTQSISIIVSAIPAPPPPVTWTFLLYLDGDNAGTAPFLNRDTPLGALYRLEQATNPNVRVVALYDGPKLGGGDSIRLIQQSNGQFSQEALGEVDMGDPQTLIDFVRWGKRQAPATFTYLAIADHANGLTGIAWDTTSGGDYLSATDLRQALTAITDNGAHPLDVLHLDGCLMGLLEIAYQVRGQARYLIASENLAWSAFAYERYREAVTSTTYGIILTMAVADGYAAHVGAYGLPYTIAALDMSKIDTIVTRTDALANELLRYALSSADNRTTLANLRAQTQTFDSTGDGRITAEDEYVDLYDWATRILSSTEVTDSTVRSAAAALRSDLTGFIVRERHLTASYHGQQVNLNQAHGVAIYYPRQLSASTYQFYGLGGLTFPVDTHWDEYLAAALAALPLGSGGEGPGPIAPPRLPSKVYLPIVLR